MIIIINIRIYIYIYIERERERKTRERGETHLQVEYKYVRDKRACGEDPNRRPARPERAATIRTISIIHK